MNLPHRRGAFVVHGHREGGPCNLAHCYYVPSPWTRAWRLFDAGLLRWWWPRT